MGGSCLPCLEVVKKTYVFLFVLLMLICNTNNFNLSISKIVSYF